MLMLILIFTGHADHLVIQLLRSSNANLNNYLHSSAILMRNNFNDTSKYHGKETKSLGKVISNIYFKAYFVFTV